ncbi:TIGR03118 family protein [Streptosporangiaceae bacterium NEAU-GS5]|nr:TIGR03118 family protein [Streptosporangiaceae bacterium NEAU-GS5]
MRASIVTLCATPLALAIVVSSVPADAGTTQKTTQKRTSTRFDEVDLVSDMKGRAAVTDARLVNPWGLAMGKALWVSDTGTGWATVYAGNGAKQPTEVLIPGGAPTGQVVNMNPDDFLIKGKPATFIFASPSGAISAWNGEVDAGHALIEAFTRNADYKGLALMNTNHGAFLLAPSFSHGRVHAFDEEFNRVRLSRWQFRDPHVPPNYAPWNVEVIGGTVMVAYAKRDPETGKPIAGRGFGFVSQFRPNGRYIRRFASRGWLNAPWAMTLAPQGFGGFSGALLIGNFGDGWINAYNPRSGRYLGALRKADGRPIAIEGLWDLEPGTATVGGTNTLWFTAGISKAQHGLLGLIKQHGAVANTSAVTSASPSPNPSHSSSGGYGY